MSTKSHSRMVRPAAAAELLGISRATLWNWTAKRADFPRPVKLGPNVTAFGAAELEAFVARQRAAQTAAEASTRPRRDGKTRRSVLAGKSARS